MTCRASQRLSKSDAPALHVRRASLIWPRTTAPFAACANATHLRHRLLRAAVLTYCTKLLKC